MKIEIIPHVAGQEACADVDPVRAYLWGGITGLIAQACLPLPLRSVHIPEGMGPWLEIETYSGRRFRVSIEAIEDAK